MFDATVRAGVLRLRRPGTRWLSSGWDGGFRSAPAAYNVSVPEGWERTDIGAYVAERRRAAGFGEDGPALLTAVDLGHARGARDGAVEAVVTAGVSNPAALPLDPEQSPDDAAAAGDRTAAGTVNVVVGTDRSLTDGALADLLAVAVEAKAATLLGETGFPGTTTDAVVVACDPTGEPVTFAGSATPVGGAARACVRDALRASLGSRYPDGAVPASVTEAEHGVSTTRRADVFRVE